MNSRTSKTALLTLTVLATAAFAALPAGASADFKLGVDEPQISQIEYGPADWTPLLDRTEASIVRRFIYWSSLAPTRPNNGSDPNDPVYMSGSNPGGRWASIDNVARIAAANGSEVLLSMYSAPAWAEGADRPTTGYGKDGTAAPWRGSWKPNPVELGKFATAIATRYSGTTPDPLDSSKTLPRIKLFEAWNEPNYKMFLSPQCSKGEMGYGNVCTKGGKIVSMSHYRLMLNAFYDGVKSVQPDATVAQAGLGPYSNSSQGYEIDPQTFTRNILCLGGTPSTPTVLSTSACPVKAKLDAVSFHPYTFNGTPTTKAYTANGGALGNAPEFRKALDLATSRGTVLPAGFKELWETESGWLTCPPCRETTSASASIGISPQLASEYTGEMIYRAWSWGVQKLVWFGLLDTDVWPGGLYYQCPLGATTKLADCSSATFADARPKLTLSAFRFPIYSGKISSSKAFAWVMSPCKVPGTTIRFEARNSKTKLWSTLTVPGPIDPKTKKATSIPLVLTLPAGTDGTIKSASWSIPTSATSVRATVSGAGCTTETSIAVPIDS